MQLLYCSTFSRKKQYLNTFKNAKNIALLQKKFSNGWWNSFCSSFVYFFKDKHQKLANQLLLDGFWGSISIAIALLFLGQLPCFESFHWSHFIYVPRYFYHVCNWDAQNDFIRAFFLCFLDRAVVFWWMKLQVCK